MHFKSLHLLQIFLILVLISLFHNQVEIITPDSKIIADDDGDKFPYCWFVIFAVVIPVWATDTLFPESVMV